MSPAPGATMPLSTSLKTRRSLVAALLVAVGATAAGCTIGDVDGEDATSSAATTSDKQDATSAGHPPQPTLGASPTKEPHKPEKPQERTDVELHYDGSATIAVAGMKGPGQTAVAPWSTMKVPIAIAALRNDPGMGATVAQAIQNSDNAAAETLWSSLGSPQQAAEATGAVISEGGSTARVETQPVRPGFSSFGQSEWSLSAQADFASHLRCIKGAEPVVKAMGNVTNGGGYGLGTIPGAIFKGGWGPDADGAYGVRQFGLIPKSEGDGGYVAVAIAVKSPDGSYESAQAELTAAAEFLKGKVGSLPAAAC